MADFFNKRMAATEESLSKIPEQLREVLTVLPPSEVEDLMKRAGFENPVRFFQAFLICGWYAVLKA